MNRFSRVGLIFAAGLIAAFALTGCSKTPASQGSQPSASTSGSQSAPQDEQTIQGTLNLLDTEQDFLVLIADDTHYRFDLTDTQADLSGFEPGDSVTITYTGTLDPDSDDIAAQLTAIAKDS